MKYILIASLLISFNLSALEPIKKGQESPVDGFVISKEEEKNLRKLYNDKVTLEQLNVLKDEKIEVQEERIKVYKEYAEDTKKLAPLGTWEKVGYFGLGFLVSFATVLTSVKIIEKTK